MDGDSKRAVVRDVQEYGVPLFFALFRPYLKVGRCPLARALLRVSPPRKNCRLSRCVHIGVHLDWRSYMAALKVGVREFRERIASFLESDAPVAVTRRGETLGVYVPTRRRRRQAAELSELKAAADRLAEALSDVDEGELVAEFKQMRRSGKAATR
jgi:hypothetical protein